MGVSKQIASNVVWRYLELVSVTGIQLISTFVMARTLSPDDYGVMGTVVVLTAFANVVVDSGFGQALIREKEVSRLDFSTVLYSNLLISALLYVILFFSSGLIATFFKTPILNSVCKVTFLILIFNALSIVHITKMQRDIKFKKLCCISIASSLLSSIIAIYLAFRYRNVWALIIQNMLMYFFKMLFLWITSDFVPLLCFSKASLKKYFAFSKNILLSAVIGTFFNNIYMLTIGKFYSMTDLGFYSQADRLKNLGSQTTTQVVQSVTYPFLAKINNETGNIKDGYKKIIAVTLIFVGGLMALLMGGALDLFELLMGSVEWRLAGFYFLLLGVNGILYPLHCINQNILMVTGDSKTVLKLEVIRRAIMLLILGITINFDISVFVFGLTLYSVLLLFLNLYYCGRPIGYTVYEQLKDISPILVRLFIMIAVALSVGWVLGRLPTMLRLSVTLFIELVIGGMLFWKQTDFKAMFSLFFTLMKR